MNIYKKVDLSNGVRLLLIPCPGTAAVTVQLLFEVGSRYESLKLNGASHYVEHMMFKGTERRPTTLDISRDLDAVGAEYNAFTGKDYTGYFIKLQADKFELAADMLEDMLFHSVYRPGDLDSERNVIGEEIRMYEDNPIMFVDELMEQELYRGSSLGRRISGTVETMKGIGRDALIGYRDSYYVPSRTVAAVSGKFDEAAVIRTMEEKFGARPEPRKPKNFQRFDTAKAGYSGARFRVCRKETEQVQLAIGFPAYPYGDEHMPALNLMSIILGGTMSSRLFVTVREKHGLAYSIHAGVNPYQDVSSVMIQAGLAKDRVHQAIKLILKELDKIRTKDVTADELRWAKENVKGRLTLNLEDSRYLADWYARQELMIKKAETPDEKLAKIMAVTREDVRRAAADVFRNKRMTMAVIGPYSDNQPFLRHAGTL
jgi:predicted Zn-dependent peptidase